MSRSPCESCYDHCPYFPDGFVDTHHLYKRSEADTATKRVFGRLTGNTVQLCRVVHEEVEATLGWLDYPPEDVMQDNIREAAAHDEIYLSLSQQRKIFGNGDS